MTSELKPWRYAIKHGPEGEASYAWVYDGLGEMVGTMKTHKAKKIVDTMNIRAEAAEAKLAQIKAQEPVKGVALHDGQPVLISPSKPMKEGFQPLYAAPVDQTVEIERLRSALARLVRNGQKQGWNDSYEDDMDFARAALSGKELS